MEELKEQEWEKPAALGEATEGDFTGGLDVVGLDSRAIVRDR